MRPASCECAWILHTRAWRETSLVVELLTAETGRVGAVARGARRPRRGDRLEAFSAIRCSLRGRGELATLADVEVVRRVPLAGEALYAGFYLNELLVRLLQREDAHPRLFALYERALTVLADLDRETLAATPMILEPVLRRFELALLDELGYGFPLDRDQGGEPLDARGRYRVHAETGVVREDLAPGVVLSGVADAPHGSRADESSFSGAELLAVAAGRFDDAEVLRAAKRITRLALAPLLGARPLASRALFARRGGSDG